MTIEDIDRVPARSITPDGALTPAAVKLAGIGRLRQMSDAVAAAPVRGPRGQLLSVAAAQQWADALACDIALDEAGGSTRHRTVGRWARLSTLLLVGVVDFPIMLWLASSVFNVDWEQPGGLPLVISVVVALVATTGAAAALHHIGGDLRDHKDERSRLAWRELPVGSWCGLIAIALLVAAIAVVMFVRVWTEGALSGLAGLAVLLAGLVALVMLVSAALVARTAFRDGSPERDDLDHYAGVVIRQLARRRALDRRAFALAHQYEILEKRASGEGGQPAGRC